MPGTGLLEDYLLSLTADSTPDGAADYTFIYDNANSELKKILVGDLPSGGGGGIGTDGWIATGDTWTYASADGPTGVFTIAGVDRSGVLQPGMRVKLTQTTLKFGIITKVAFSTNTTVTVYFGTDYTLANAAITSPNYSPVKAPFGFNCDPAKWTEEVTDTTARSASGPTVNVWVNLGSVTISIPIGAWLVSYQVVPTITGLLGTWTVYTTLSTANNSESDSDLSAFIQAGGVTALGSPINRAKLLDLAAKTSYFLNTLPNTASATSIGNSNANSPLFIRAVCAYL